MRIRFTFSMGFPFTMPSQYVSNSEFICAVLTLILIVVAGLVFELADHAFGRVHVIANT